MSEPPPDQDQCIRALCALVLALQDLGAARGDIFTALRAAELAAGAEATAEQLVDEDERAAVMAVITALPDDREAGLRILDAARRMVERFKR